MWRPFLRIINVSTISHASSKTIFTKQAKEIFKHTYESTFTDSLWLTRIEKT